MLEIKGHGEYYCIKSFTEQMAIKCEKCKGTGVLELKDGSTLECPICSGKGHKNRYVDKYRASKVNYDLIILDRETNKLKLVDIDIDGYTFELDAYDEDKLFATFEEANAEADRLNKELGWQIDK